MAYIDLLKDPRWQRKRLEILQRDNWTCQDCGDTKTSLHVHHRRYERGRPPWASDSRDLVTLCEPCHELVTKLSRETGGLVSAVPPGSTRGAINPPRRRHVAARRYLEELRAQISSIDFWANYQGDQISEMARQALEDDSAFLDHLLDEVLPDPAHTEFGEWSRLLFAAVLRAAGAYLEMHRKALGVAPPSSASEEH